MAFVAKVVSLGETCPERMRILDVADRYGRLCKELEVQVIPPAAWRSAGNCMTARYQCQRFQLVGCSAYLAGESEVVSTNAILLGARGSHILNVVVKMTSRSIIDSVREYQRWPNLSGFSEAGFLASYMGGVPRRAAETP